LLIASQFIRHTFKGWDNIIYLNISLTFDKTFCFIFRVIFRKPSCRRLKKIFNVEYSAQTLKGFVISGAEDLQNQRDKKNYASQQIHRNLGNKLDKINTEMLDDTEEKLKVVQNKLKELEDHMKLFDNTWDNLINQVDEEMVEGFTDDFGSLSSETAKSKLSSAGNSEQPTEKTDIGETWVIWAT